MGVAQSKDDSTRKYLCHSLQFTEQHPPQEENLSYIRTSCWSTCLSWITSCQGNLKEANQNQKMFNRAALQIKDGIMERCTSESWTIQYPEMSHGLINGLALATSLHHIVLIRPKNPNCISHNRGNSFSHDWAHASRTKPPQVIFQPIFVKLSTATSSTKHFLYYQITKEVNKPGEPQLGVSPSWTQLWRISRPRLSTVPWQESYLTPRTTNWVQEIQVEKANWPPSCTTSLSSAIKGRAGQKGQRKYVDTAHTVHFIDYLF